MIVHGTPEWFAARLGKPTGSNMWRVMEVSESWKVAAVCGEAIEYVSNHTSERTAREAAEKKGNKDTSKTYTAVQVFEPKAERQSYMVELLTERLTGSVLDHPVTFDMQRGVDLEPEAIAAYELVSGLDTRKAHWFDMGRWGCTPDALTECGNVVSIKCPKTSTVIKQRCFEPEIPTLAYWQAVAEMSATGAKWVDLVTYDNRFANPAHRTWIRRIDRDESVIARLLREIAAFCNELDAASAAYGCDDSCL